MDPNDIVTGGACWGVNLFVNFRVISPFASLQIASDELVLEVDLWVTKRIHRFSRTSILALRPRRVLFWRGIQIHHTNDYPQLAIFFPKHPDILARRLELAGYAIAS